MIHSIIGLISDDSPNVWFLSDLISQRNWEANTLAVRHVVYELLRGIVTSKMADYL
jgi:hypothetical protein